jgi:hypothetical protein
MPPRQVAALWRTSLVAVLALAASACGQAADPSGPKTTAARPALMVVQQGPLTVQGTGFQPGEKVRLAAKGLQSSLADATAGAAGTFEASFDGLKECDSVTVTAVGSKGSRAEFNLSQIACTGT